MIEEIDDDQSKLKKTIELLEKISEKCASNADSIEASQIATDSNATEENIILDIDRDIFGWSTVMTDFELFSSFLPLLKQSNTMLHSIEEENHCLQFKHLLWSLFSGFGHHSKKYRSRKLTTDFANDFSSLDKSTIKITKQRLNLTNLS